MSSVPTSASDAGSLPGPVRVAHGRTDRSPSRALVEAIAALAGVEPDALDSLVEHRPDREVALSFAVADYDVRIDRDEVVARLAE